MLFNEYQYKLWCKMLSFIRAFHNGELSYWDLVYSLEGALNAGEFKNEGIIEEWYDYWTPLENWSAIKGNNVTVEDVKQNLSDMESFFKRVLLEDFVD